MCLVAVSQMTHRAFHKRELAGGAYRWLWVLLPGQECYATFQLNVSDPMAHATARRVLEHFRLSTELHRVYLMGEELPVSSESSRTLVDIADDTDLWEFVSEDAGNLFLLVVELAADSLDYCRSAYQEDFPSQ